MEAFTKLVEELKVDSRHLGGKKRENCQLTNQQLFEIVLLLPFVAVKGFSHYASSALSRMFGGKKDILYSFMQQDEIDWRKLVSRISIKLIRMVTVRKDFKKSHLPTVLICDDTDLPKTGFKMEGIGRIFSHVHQKSILGYKALMLVWSDGRTQFMVESSLHGEIGKTKDREQGLTAAQRKARYVRERDENTPSAKRKAEYFTGKGQMLIEMVKRAIKSGIPFEYLLVDSWFTNTELVDFVCKCRKKFHLLGMARMGNTKYTSKEWGELNAKGLLSKLSKTKSIKYSRRYRCNYATADVVLGTRAVRLFFCRRGKRDNWKILLTTNVKLDFMTAYEIYAMRWSIEVCFSDSKRLLGLADCSARDFSSQLAHVSVVMIRYNLLASIKRAYDYETIGGLFNDIYLGVHELTVMDKLWEIVLDVVAVVAEMIGADEDDLIRQIIDNDKRLKALKMYAAAG